MPKDALNKDPILWVEKRLYELAGLGWDGEQEEPPERPYVEAIRKAYQSGVEKVCCL